MEEELKKYNLKLRESDDSERDLIDFSIEDEEDNIAWVWGNDYNDVDWECNHPYECVEFGDIDEQGECILCGSYCDWHYEKDDEGHKVPEPHEWYTRRNVGGLIKKYIEELRDKNHENTV